MQQRQCIVLRGSYDWCKSASESLLAEFSPAKMLWLSDDAPEQVVFMSQKLAKTQLGKEFDAVVFDGLTSINPDDLGIILGTVKAGGVVVLWLDNVDQATLWLQRFNQVVTNYDQQSEHFTVVQQGQNVTKLSPPQARKQSEDIYLTSDQHEAVKAILKVIHGHRRRPLVLSADRGRGKSASLGIAAAQLLLEGKQKILVTASSLRTVDTVFEQAQRLLPNAECSAGLISINNAEIRFIAPDILIESASKADLLLVDEAAAIPVSMLEKLVQCYSRLVFATTVHGYEGTGRGFTVRFQKILDQKAPDWQSYKMHSPIRWSEDDRLEAFSFESLLLDAEPVANELIETAEVSSCSFEQLDREQLIHDEQSLRALFGLMVLAHYRTRPSDLQMMLDRDDISVYVMRFQGHIIASAWLTKEGQLVEDLAAAIYAGQRRLKGHLLPQSLLAHAGIINAGSLSYQRIIRIAVHPAVQQRGIGQAFLAKISGYVAQDNDLIGTSFGVNLALLSFWRQANFLPARLGVHRDDVSGSHAIMMLQALSPAGQTILDNATKRFQQHWPYLLHNQFNDLTAELVVAISQTMPQQKIQLSDSERYEIEAFALSQRGYDFCQVTLWHWLKKVVSSRKFVQLSQQQQALCVMAILQQRDWAYIANRLNYKGKSQLIAALRQAIKVLLP